MREMPLERESYSFWLCSNHLPLYLTPRPPSPPSTTTSSTTPPTTPRPQQQPRVPPVRLEPCGSVCREVERRCPFFILGHEDDKAAGNPSFICKDEYIPPVLHSDIHYSHCCYKSVPDPEPGNWFSINATLPNHHSDHAFNRRNSRQNADSRPFCVEPDSDEVDTDEAAFDGVRDFEVAGWTGLRNHRDRDLQKCESLFHPPPDAGLAVSGVAKEEWRAWNHHLSNDSIESAVLAVAVDDDMDAELRRLHDLLDREHLLFWNVARFFGLVDDSVSSSSSAIKPPTAASLAVVAMLTAGVQAPLLTVVTALVSSLGSSAKPAMAAGLAAVAKLITSSARIRPSMASLLTVGALLTVSSFPSSFIKPAMAALMTVVAMLVVITSSPDVWKWRKRKMR